MRVEQGKQLGIGRSFGAAAPATAANVNVKTSIAKNFFMVKLLLRSGVKVTARRYPKSPYPCFGYYSIHVFGNQNDWAYVDNGILPKRFSRDKT